MEKHKIKKNCWEIKKCGREDGGDNVKEFGVCPASVLKCLDGLNDGKNGGRCCWVVAGTYCEGEIQGTYAKKIIGCYKCEFHQLVQEEEGEKFSFLKEGINKLEVDSYNEESEDKEKDI
ncbi:MAG: hypothetical protein KKF78_04925 [Candidatus Omnitrophica bacterium]|nr:hypothetical protein [Candidatus Omnitrophota bacterium]MBU1996481.1 hypothetical protein [Candidatus Omnitrophota bacterium]